MYTITNCSWETFLWTPLLFDELEKLSPSARQELVRVFQFASRAVAERRELSPSQNNQEALAHLYRCYLCVANALMEGTRSMLSERIEASAAAAASILHAQACSRTKRSRSTALTRRDSLHVKNA